MNDRFKPQIASTQSKDHRDRMLLIGLMLPMMMAIVNMAMFSVALPTIRDSFGLRADVTAWVVAAYSLPL